MASSMKTQKSREDIGYILDSRGPALLEAIDPSEELLLQLVKHKVARHVWCLNLKGKDHAAKIIAILDLVRAGTVEQYYDFIDALNDSGQTTAADILQGQTDRKHWENSLSD